MLGLRANSETSSAAALQGGPAHPIRRSQRTLLSSRRTKCLARRFTIRAGPLIATRGMSDTGLTVSGMTEPPSRYDVTVTVATDGGCGPDPSGFAVAAGQAASSRNASVMSAHMWEKIISVVTVQAPDRSSAVAVALAVVSEALRRPAAPSSR